MTGTKSFFTNKYEQLNVGVCAMSTQAILTIFIAILVVGCLWGFIMRGTKKKIVIADNACYLSGINNALERNRKYRVVFEPNMSDARVLKLSWNANLVVVNGDKDHSGIAICLELKRRSPSLAVIYMTLKRDDLVDRQLQDVDCFIVYKINTKADDLLSIIEDVL